LHVNNYHVEGTLLDINYLQHDVFVRYSSTYKVENLDNGLLGKARGLPYAATHFRTITDDGIADSGRTISVSANPTNPIVYHLDNDNKRYKLSFVQIYRPDAIEMYVTVAPIVATLKYQTAASIDTAKTVQTNHYELTSEDGIHNNNITLGIHGMQAPYNLHLKTPYTDYKSIPSKIVFTPKPHTFKIFGGQDGTELKHQDNITATSFRYNQDISNLSLDIEKAETEIKVDWNTTFYPRLYNQKYTVGTIVPETNMTIKSYHVGFELNVTGGAPYPVVKKFTSKPYSSKLISLGYIDEFQTDTTVGKNVRYTLNATTASAIDFPYKNCVSDYPIPASYSDLNSAVHISSQNITLGVPVVLDLTLRVKNVETYAKLINPTFDNKVNVIKIDAKDQFVVKDYLNNLSMRIGPNGRLYVGDVSSYTFAIYSNQVENKTVSAPYAPVYNSAVVLGNGELFVNNAN
jgi:hypothetical protein